LDAQKRKTEMHGSEKTNWMRKKEKLKCSVLSEMTNWMLRKKKKLKCTAAK
jgi:hypothetical protein